MNHKKCFICGSKNSIRIIDGKTICGECRNNGYSYSCECCQTIHLKANGAVKSGYSIYCPSCAKELGLCACIVCGTGLNHETRIAFYGKTYCHPCFAAAYGINVRDYHDQPALYYYSDKFKKEPLTSSVKAFGVELEISGGTRQSVPSGYAENCRKLMKRGNAALFFMHDGSVGNGFEIITQPCSFEYVTKKSFWDNVSKTAAQFNYKSHDTNCCGLHIHTSRAWYGDSPMAQDLAIAKTILLVTKHWRDVVRFSRRREDALSQFAAKPVFTVSSHDTDADIVQKARYAQSGGRYTAVNLQNRATVEFRVFRGTLRVDTIIACIQLVKNLIDISVNTALVDIFKVKWNGIINHNAAFTALIAYDKNLKAGE